MFQLDTELEWLLAPPRTPQPGFDPGRHLCSLPSGKKKVHANMWCLLNLTSDMARMKKNPLEI